MTCIKYKTLLVAMVMLNDERRPMVVNNCNEDGWCSPMQETLNAYVEGYIPPRYPVPALFAKYKPTPYGFYRWQQNDYAYLNKGNGWKRL